MSVKPKVSIGVPVFNGEDYLEEALDSILAQTFRDFEVVISDNASTDRTSEICRSYAQKDKRIQYWHSNTNRGASWNFNRVFRLSQGEYFKWVAADDAIEPDYLKHCVEVLNDDPTVVLACTRIIIVDEIEQSVEPRATDHDFSSPSPYERWVAMFHRARSVECIFGLMRTCELAQTSLLKAHIRADFCLLQELVLKGKFRQIPEHLIRLRTHPKAFHAIRRRLPSGEGFVIDSESARKRAEWFDPANKGRLICHDGGCSGNPWR